jgi:ATP-dependent Clp protease protease subunit
VNSGSLDDLLRAYSANRMQLEAEGIYYLREIDDDAAERFSRSVLLMASAREGRPDAPITLYINSPGGSVGAGFAMMEIAHRVQHIHKVPINTVIMGFAYSMAAVLSQIGTKRSMGSMSMMMIHSSSWSLSGEDSRIFRDYQKLAGHYQGLISSIFASRTGQHTPTWWRRFIYSGHDRFLDPTECLKLGLVDEVLNYPDDPALHAPRSYR